MLYLLGTVMFYLSCFIEKGPNMFLAYIFLFDVFSILYILSVVVIPIDWVSNPLLRIVQVSLPTVIHLLFPYNSSVLPAAL